MNAMRVIKTIDTTNLYELEPYIGRQVEIIIFPLANERDQEDEDDIEFRRRKFFNMIDKYAGTISPWTREELYVR